MTEKVIGIIGQMHGFVLVRTPAAKRGAEREERMVGERREKSARRLRPAAPRA